MRIRYTKIKRLCLVQNFSSDSLIVYTQLKAELHPKVELPLIVLLPPSGATFGIVRGGAGYLSFTGMLSPLPGASAAGIDITVGLPPPQFSFPGCQASRREERRLIHVQ